MKIGFANGVFDILHFGHIYLFREAKKQVDFLVVGINTDESTKRLKGNGRPINNMIHRLSILQELKPIDLVLPFSEDTPEKIIKAIKPDILFKGGDWKKEDVVGKDFVESYGGRVEIIQLIPGISTSIIEGKLK